MRLPQILVVEHRAQLLRFLLLGCSNTLLVLAIYTALLQLQLPYLVATGLSFAAGAANGYLLHHRWTFRSPDSYRSRFRYVVVLVGGLAACSFLVRFFVEAGVGRILAYVVALPPVTLAMYATNRSWTFNRR
jgi:putative flippase GtrA